MRSVTAFIRPRYGLAARFVNVALSLAAVLFCPLAVAAEPVSILVLGDSLTAGRGLSRQASFPARLQKALLADGLDVEVIDGGVSGNTTAAGLARLDWALAAKPDAVIVELGGNDGLRGLEPKATYANLDEILTRIRKSRLSVLLAGMKAPPNLGGQYGAEFNAVYARLAVKHGVRLYPFFLAGVAAVPELNQEDGIHPNARGVDVIVRRILPFVKRLIGERR
ncbi:MAG: arylesterase [Rhodospirillales bacterium]